MSPFLFVLLSFFALDASALLPRFPRTPFRSRIVENLPGRPKTEGKPENVPESFPAFDLDEIPKDVGRLDEYRNGIRVRSGTKSSFDYILEDVGKRNHVVKVLGADVQYVKDKAQRVIQSQATFTPLPHFVGDVPYIVPYFHPIRESRTDWSKFLEAIGAEGGSGFNSTESQDGEMGLIWGQQLYYLSSMEGNDDPLNIVSLRKDQRERLESLEHELAGYMREGATVYARVKITYQDNLPKRLLDRSPESAIPASLDYSYTLSWPKDYVAEPEAYWVPKVLVFSCQLENNDSGTLHRYCGHSEPM